MANFPSPDSPRYEDPEGDEPVVVVDAQFRQGQGVGQHRGRGRVDEEAGDARSSTAEPRRPTPLIPRPEPLLPPEALHSRGSSLESRSGMSPPDSAPPGTADSLPGQIELAAQQPRTATHSRHGSGESHSGGGRLRPRERERREEKGQSWGSQAGAGVGAGFSTSAPLPSSATRHRQQEGQGRDILSPISPTGGGTSSQRHRTSRTLGPGTSLSLSQERAQGQDLGQGQGQGLGHSHAHSQAHARRKRSTHLSQTWSAAELQAGLSSRRLAPRYNSHDGGLGQPPQILPIREGGLLSPPGSAQPPSSADRERGRSSGEWLGVQPQDARGSLFTPPRMQSQRALLQSSRAAPVVIPNVHFKRPPRPVRWVRWCVGMAVCLGLFLLCDIYSAGTVLSLEFFQEAVALRSVAWTLSVLGLFLYVLALLFLVLKRTPFQSIVTTATLFAFTARAISAAARAQALSAEHFFDIAYDSEYTSVQALLLVNVYAFIYFTLLLYHAPHFSVNPSLAAIEDVPISQLRARLRQLEGQKMDLASKRVKVMAPGQAGPNVGHARRRSARQSGSYGLAAGGGSGAKSVRHNRKRSSQIVPGY